MADNRIVARDGTYYVQAEFVKIGDKLDLEGDAVADPNGDGIGESGHYYPFEFEFARVEAVEREGATCVVLDTNLGTWGFPVDHELEISLED